MSDEAREIITGVDVNKIEALRKPAKRLLEAAYEYWKAYQELHLPTSAVVWLKDSKGGLVIFTRGEYKNQLMENIDTHIYGESDPELEFPELVEEEANES